LLSTVPALLFVGRGCERDVDVGRGGASVVVSVAWAVSADAVVSGAVVVGGGVAKSVAVGTTGT
jgi:hypothetical protein